MRAYEFARVQGAVLADWWRGQRARRERVAMVREEVERKESRPPPRIEPRIATPPPSQRVERERQEPLFERALQDGLPELALLDTPRAQGGGYSAEALEAMSRQVELKLKDFNIDVEVVAVHPGPVITRFELEPAPGIKASRITNLSKDLARSLSTVSVRVVEVIPGKTCIGLEIPNERREIVALSDILKSDVYERSASKLTMALGKDIAGQPTVVDLAKMPHLLVAGTTGAGKSVALNAMILSLLYKSTPDDVRLIMIDPKMLELSVYEGIPALLAPVVTDMKEAANALRWCVAEMERRYKLMAALGVRNIGGYNRKVEEARAKGQPLADPLYRKVEADDEAPPLDTLPYIVVVIDELADLMMVVGKKVEELIARLAQKARAAGVHLILATQRPSVDVITGLIKANIPTRIAFQVSSRIDSRTILDQMGAETLLGHGDMLYLPPAPAFRTGPRRLRVRRRVHKVVERLKASASPSTSTPSSPVRSRTTAAAATGARAAPAETANKTNCTTWPCVSSPRPAGPRSRVSSAGSRSATTAPRAWSKKWSVPAWSANCSRTVRAKCWSRHRPRIEGRACPRVERVHCPAQRAAVPTQHAPAITPVSCPVRPLPDPAAGGGGGRLCPCPATVDELVAT